MKKQKKWKSELVRFNAEFGPQSLFDRVKYKMQDVHELYMGGAHYNEQTSARDIPEDVIAHIRDFKTEEWKLVTAEVRADRGKFYNSTWEYAYNNERYWMTIGIGNYVVTIVRKDSSGVDKCIREGEFYDYVEKVNRKLMEAESETVTL